MFLWSLGPYQRDLVPSGRSVRLKAPVVIWGCMGFEFAFVKTLVGHLLVTPSMVADCSLSGKPAFSQLWATLGYSGPLCFLGHLASQVSVS